MPVYDFRCEAGHFFDRRASYEETVTRCQCGAPARRQSVYRLTYNRHGGKLASEFVMPAEMQKAHEEAKGYAAEVRAIAAEERANGYGA